jgi:hypothetical protein
VRCRSRETEAENSPDGEPPSDVVDESAGRAGREPAADQPHHQGGVHPRNRLFVEMSPVGLIGEMSH